MDAATLKAGVKSELDYIKDRAMLPQRTAGTPAPSQAGGPPDGATMKVPGSDGKMHWSDGKRDLGVVQ